MKRHSLTKKQRELVDKDLTSIMQRLSDITVLLNVCYGSESPVSTRLEEAHAALEGLLWALGSPTPPDQTGATRVQEVGDQGATRNFVQN